MLERVFSVTSLWMKKCLDERNDRLVLPACLLQRQYKLNLHLLDLRIYQIIKGTNGDFIFLGISKVTHQTSRGVAEIR